MNLFQVGERTINLDYLVSVEPRHDSREGVHVTMVTGTGFDVDPPDADALRRWVEQRASNRPPSEPGAASGGVVATVGNHTPRPRKARS